MNKRYFTILSTVSILAILAIGGAFLFNQYTKKVEQELVGLHEEVQTLSVQSERLINLRQVTHNTGDDLSTLQHFFVPKDGALDFVKYIEGLAQSSGLVFRIDTVDEVQDARLSEYNKSFLKLSVRVTGSVKRIRLFVSLIESLPYNTKIQRFDLRRFGDEWTAVMDISVVKEIEK